MKHLRTLLLSPVLLLASSHLRAYETYSAQVCNKGQLSVDVAVAYRAFGFNDEFWVIDGWYEVPQGKCKTVLSHQYAEQSRNWLGFRSFPVHLAFAFTDSTGVWGAANVKPPRDVAASRLQLCVTRKNFEYRVDVKDPATACRGQSNAFLIGASIDHEPTAGDYFNHAAGMDYPGISVTVALGPNDRAIPLGPQASTGGAAKAPGTKEDLLAILNEAIRGPDSPKPRISGTYINLEVCVPPNVVKKESWANPPTARTKAFRQTVRQFLVSQSFGNVTGRRVSLRVMETGNKFMAEEVSVCPGDFTFGLQWGPAEPPAAAPPPAAKPAPQPAPGFGDLLGPGGFVKPPS